MRDPKVSANAPISDCCGAEANYHQWDEMESVGMLDVIEIHYEVWVCSKCNKSCQVGPPQSMQRKGGEDE